MLKTPDDRPVGNTSEAIDSLSRISEKSAEFQVTYHGMERIVITGKASEIDELGSTHGPRRSSKASAVSRSEGRVIFRLPDNDSTIITCPPDLSMSSASSVTNQSSETARR
jgi:hypothetical protein